VSEVLAIVVGIFIGEVIIGCYLLLELLAMRWQRRREARLLASGAPAMVFDREIITALRKR
jgi:hypothetical protein